MHASAFELLVGVSRALDLVKPQLAGHHLGVAWIADTLSHTLSLPQTVRQQIFVADMLHDVGTIPLKVSADDLLFERKTWLHARAGWALLSHCASLAPIASLVLFHHTPWSKLRDCDEALFPANIIHLADRMELLLRSENLPPSTLERRFAGGSGKLFRLSYVEALHAAFFSENRELHLPSAQEMESALRVRYAHMILDQDKLNSFCFLFSLLTDFLSPFTATHTAGVAHTACILHRRHQMRTTGRVDPEENHKVFIAGLLHDIGKLGVPCALLEKPGALDHDEFTQIKRHAELSLQLLDNIPGFEDIRLWGALHHERLNGKGYPLGLAGDQLSLPSRVMAVADIFTALTEDRPYRKGMPLAQAFDILQTMKDNDHVDGNILATLQEDADRINKVRIAAQRCARRRFDELYRMCSAPAESDIRGMLRNSPRKDGLFQA